MASVLSGKNYNYVIYATGWEGDTRYFYVTFDAQKKSNQYAVYKQGGIENPRYMIGFGSGKKAITYAAHAADELGWAIGMLPEEHEAKQR